jgi:hypothetical protein
VRERNTQRAEQILGHGSAFGLPRIAFAELAAVTDQHEEWNAVQLRTRDDAVDRCEKPVILHEHCRLHAGQVRAGRNADALLLFGEAHENRVRVFVGKPHQMHQPGFRQRRDEADTAGFERVVNQLGMEG